MGPGGSESKEMWMLAAREVSLVRVSRRTEWGGATRAEEARLVRANAVRAVWEIMVAV